MKAWLFERLRGFYRRFGGPKLGLGLHDKLQPLVQRFLQPERVELDGFHLYLDPTDRTISYQLAVHRVWEPFETDVFKTLVKPGATILDVGAQIGYFTLLASTLAGPSGRVYAFEPEPRNLALLRKNVAGNARANVTVVPKGVSDTPGRATLRLHPANKGGHSLYAAGGRLVEIETIALGAWMKENGVAPSFIKLDIEGGEWRALEGMAGFLRESGPLAILLEYFPEAIARSGREPRAWLDRLVSLRFRLRVIDERALELRDVKPDEVDAAVAGRSGNLLFERL